MAAAFQQHLSTTRRHHKKSPHSCRTPLALDTHKSLLALYLSHNHLSLLLLYGDMKTPLPPPSPELPNCFYTAPPSLIRPSAPTPAGSLYLSNLDDQHFLRFSIKYLHIFKASVPAETLKQSLSRVLVDYYPLAGRLRRSCHGDDRKFEVDCNGEGALFAEASMDLTAEELLGLSRRLNRSWRKLLYMAEGQSFMNAPPLIVQVSDHPVISFVRIKEKLWRRLWFIFSSN